MDNKDTIVYRIKELDPDIIAPSTSNMDKLEQGGSKIVIIGKPGCFARGTKILMYDGTMKNVEDVEVGDLVMGDDGTKRNVLELCRNKQKMYRIQGYYEEGYTVNASHKLVLRNINTQHIKEITVKKYLKMKQSWKDRHVLYKSGKLIFDQEYIKSTGVKPRDVYKDSTSDISRSLIQTISYRKKVLYSMTKAMTSKQLCRYNIPLCIYEYTFDNLKQTEDFLFLTRSLGYFTFKTKVLVNNTYIFRVDMYDVDENLKNQIPVNEYWFDVNFLGVGNYYGFRLDGNHRFLLGTFDVVRNTGKSTLISNLIYEKSHIFSSGMVCSGTEDSNHHYSKIFPETFVYGKLELQKINDFIERQKLIKKISLPNPWSLLLLDDCTDDPKLFNEPLFQGIFKNGRHWKMWFILSLQYCLDIKPVIRTNIDGTFILRETNLKNRKSLWENYAGVIPDFKQFCDIMDQITNDHTALYIHNATTSNKIEDCVFWYKGKKELPSGFRVGCDEFWDFHNQRFDPKKSILN